MEVVVLEVYLKNVRLYCLPVSFSYIFVYKKLKESILELVINQTLAESSVPVTVAVEIDNVAHQEGMDDLQICEHGHSRNSSNTSQMSKASGYSSIHSHTHSRQSSSGDSGHIR